MKDNFIILTAAFVLVFNSCNADSSDSNKGNILPLANGNEWVFSDSIFSIASSKVSEGPRVSSVGRRSRSKRIQSYSLDSSRTYVSDLLTISYQNKPVDVFAIKWFESLSSQPDGVSLTYFERNESEGLVIYGFGQAGRDTVLRSLDLKYPVKVGDAWLRTTAFFDNSSWILFNDSVDCISTDYSYLTQIGTFDCIVYRTRIGESAFYEYYVPEVGLIGNLNDFQQRVLRRYSLN